MNNQNLNQSRFLLILICFALFFTACQSGVIPVETQTIETLEIDPYIIPPFPGPVTTDGEITTVSPVLSKDYIVNPGIGWQDGPEPFGILDFPETVDYSFRRKISWAILNPEQGVYDWSALDEQLLAAKAEGKQFSFRVYTMVGEDFDGYAIPQWVIENGASLFEDGEPDYSNCIYQQEWGNFVNELARRYDGNPDIAFVDISGYGNFNEWSWQDQQTEWDDAWEEFPQEENYKIQDYFTTIDGQARRRLADMYIGGEYLGHTCRNADGEDVLVDYSYVGFQRTQLMMPYSGIVQSSQYVYMRRPDVGFRYDCLGYRGDHVYEKINTVLLNIWRTAPVAFELCRPEDVDAADAKWLLNISHGSVVHNNNWEFGVEELTDMMNFAGYRYFLRNASFVVDNRLLKTHFVWQNVGNAPNYPAMGQNFQVNFHLLDLNGKPVHSKTMPVEISNWMPSSTLPLSMEGYVVDYSFEIPDTIPSGKYLTAVEIFDLRTGASINLAMGGRDQNGLYILSELNIK